MKKRILTEQLGQWLVSGVLLVVAQVGWISTAQAADSCLQTTELTSREKDLLAELNRARTDPKGFGEDVRKLFAGMNKRNILKLPDGSLVQYTEGRSAVDEALAFLKKAKAVKPLTGVGCLTLAARDHAAEQSRTGQTGHESQDGSGPSERAARYLNGPAYCGENIAYGDHSAFQSVANLIVDDGVPSRGHRSNLFNPDYKTVGIASDSHPEYGGVQVQLLCLNDIRGVAPAGNSTPSASPDKTGGSASKGKAHDRKPDDNQETGVPQSADDMVVQETTETTRVEYLEGKVVTTIVRTVKTRYRDGREEEETSTRSREEYVQ